MKGTRANFILLAISVALVLTAIETGFRIRAYRMDSASYIVKNDIEYNLRYSYGDTFTDHGYGNLIKFSDDEKIVFELKPHLNDEYSGAMVNTSMLGFRDRYYPYDKPPGTVRIIGIGDSVMFGQGVAEGQDYLSVLEQALNSRNPGKRWDVINMAAPEYNTVIEVETLRAKGLKFHPDIVVLGFISNDLNLPLFVQYMGMPEEAPGWTYYLAPTRSFALDWFMHRRANPGELLASSLPNRYASLGGRENAVAALRELSELSRRERFVVIAFFLTPELAPLDREFMGICNSLGFVVVDGEPPLKLYMKYKGITDYYDSALSVPDGHPSAIAHQLAGDTLYLALVKSGLLARYAKP